MPHIEQRDLQGAWRRETSATGEAPPRRLSCGGFCRSIFVLEHSNMIWLPAEPEKLEFF